MCTRARHQISSPGTRQRVFSCQLPVPPGPRYDPRNAIMNNQAQLIAYVDRLAGGSFGDLRELLDGPLAGAFGGVHVLPFFHPIDGADAGFDPIDHTQVDARLGTWDDVASLAARTE